MRYLIETRRDVDTYHLQEIYLTNMKKKFDNVTKTGLDLVRTTSKKYFIRQPSNRKIARE